MSKYSSAAIRGGVVLVAAMLLTGCNVEEPSRTDAYYEELVTGYIRGDRSEEAEDAVACVEGRDELGQVVRSFAPWPSSDQQGLSVDEIRQVVEESNTRLEAGWTEGLWDSCPNGGEYGVRFYESITTRDGVAHWSMEISCSVHTPEAYGRYLDGVSD